ncbi:acyl-CoA synthetase (AMP-forming)/AMP-acid ligase II [Nonomuraea fuscirosea]|uniref:Acyl-CoA synthetase (AMP-forming)/AMP-acid ligase II n=1 Tax=Nonomuraea fuscirosea TaxID=1291556 RepID=A0A2T0MQ45_9ACTN|nr:AMP-binding protein [Nonomuraea fuscirosea]PRX60279.1 acyl-CoA synthetase (AMP-forming)/AMP-acid ligase II [Nonomuraea fuscirosea]
MRIERLLRQNAVRRGPMTAVICEQTQLSWAELDVESNRLANALIALGYRAQERIALVLSNCHHIVTAFHGAWKANLVTVGINTRLTAPEIARILTHSGASLIVCDTPAAVEAARTVPGVRGVYTVGLDGASFTDLVASGAPDEVPETGTGDELRSLRYTSGTTGASKGCMATHDQQVASTANYLCEVNVPRGGPTWISVPLTLGVGASFVTTTAYLGVPLLLRRRFDAAGFVDDVGRYGVEHAFLVPTMLVDLVRALPELDLTRASPLKLVGYGGASVSWSLIRSLAEALDLEFYHAFGATEAGGFVALLTPDDHRNFLRTETASIVPVGRPAAFADVKIFDAEDKEVAVRETGEMRIRAASVFSGYWSQPEATRAVLKDGWLRLGDMAWRDERGYIYLADRAQGVIRSGAQNVYAGEVEAVLQACPGVERAAVIGVPHERFGESVKALVQRVPGADLTERQVLDYCAERLAGYKRPREVEFVTGLPVDEGGKIRRAELKRVTGTRPLGEVTTSEGEGLRR